MIMGGGVSTLGESLYMVYTSIIKTSDYSFKTNLHGYQHTPSVGIRIVILYIKFYFKRVHECYLYYLD